MPKVLQKKAKPYNWDSKIMSAIRKVWRFSPERRAALADRTNPDHGTILCAHCFFWIHPKLATVDHADPVVPVTGFDSWDGVIHRMRHNRLVVLCDPCHKAKTKAENAERARYRRLQKGRKAG